MATRGKRARGGGRFYTWAVDGGTERYWSVTTIIDGGTPSAGNALKWWAAGKVAEFAYDEASNWLGMTRSRAIDYLKREPMRYTGERADLGTAVHDVAEAVALGKPAPEMDNREERAVVARFLDWAKTARPRFVLTEAEVFSRTQRYAGRLDAIVEFDTATVVELSERFPIPAEWLEACKARGKCVLLLDYKTGGDVAADKGVYPEVALQLNAYGRAEFVGLANGDEAPLPDLDGAFVLHLGAQGWRMVPVRLGDDVYRAFLHAREVFRFTEQISQTVLGHPMESILPRNPLTEN